MAIDADTHRLKSSSRVNRESASLNSGSNSAMGVVHRNLPWSTSRAMRRVVNGLVAEPIRNLVREVTCDAPPAQMTPWLSHSAMRWLWITATENAGMCGAPWSTRQTHSAASCVDRSSVRPYLSSFWAVHRNDTIKVSHRSFSANRSRARTIGSTPMVTTSAAKRTVDGVTRMCRFPTAAGCWQVTGKPENERPF
jgi:hypothetical protein